MSPPAARPAGHSYTLKRRKQDFPAFPLKLGEHEFTYYPDRIPPLMMMDLPGMAVSDDSTPMWKIFEVLMPQDHVRFRRLVQSPEYDVSADDLAHILADMISDAAERPI